MFKVYITVLAIAGGLYHIWQIMITLVKHVERRQLPRNQLVSFTVNFVFTVLATHAYGCTLYSYVVIINIILLMHNLLYVQWC